MKIGKLVFLYDFLQESKKRVFRVDSNPQALKAAIKSPSKREAGQSNTFLVYVSSGKSHVAEATLSLFPASEGISLSLVPSLTFTKENADGSESEAVPGEILLENYDAVALPAFGPNETIVIAVPYESAVEVHEHFLKLVVQYLAPNAKRHAFSLTTSIDTLLPLQVSHSVIWRDQKYENRSCSIAMECQARH